MLLQFHVGTHGMAFSATPIHAFGSQPETTSALHKWCIRSQFDRYTTLATSLTLEHDCCQILISRMTCIASQR
jgi:hypothetical protein